MQPFEIKLKKGEGAVKRLKQKTSPDGLSKFFYVMFRHNGKKVKINSKSEHYQEAYNLMIETKLRLTNGSQAAKSTVIFRWEHMRDLLLADYREKGNFIFKSKDGTENFRGRSYMDAFFRNMPVSEMDFDKIAEYKRHVEGQGLKGPTIRRHLNSLRRAFELAKDAQKIFSVPSFSMPPESKAAGTIIEPSEFKTILANIPEISRPIFQFMNLTCCRVGAAVKIDWTMVSKDCSELNLPAWIMKADNAITLTLNGMLKPIADQLRDMKDRTGPVFYSENYLEVWQDACVAAGMGRYEGKGKRAYRGVRIHDNRVAGARNAIRAGVSQKVVMDLAGWKTDHVFRRYNITSIADITDAMLKVEKYLETAA